MAYTTINKSTDYFNTKIYTGNGGTQSINVGFQPDWSWFKSRDASNYHALIDAVRGETKVLYSNGTDVEATYTAVDFTSTGYDLTHNSSLNSINSNGSTKVAWNWLANGTGSANTAGTINSTVSVNTTAGFSIVSFTATGSASTIGHGLGVVPKVVLVKSRTAVLNWFMYNSNFSGANDFITLNETGAVQANSVVFNGTAPTSSVFSVGTVHGNGSDVIAYCFAEKTGYSKFGSYTGNGNADGTFIYTGFKPAFVIHKRTDTGASWMMYDNKRQTINPKDQTLFADLNNAESGGDAVDFLSNGFKQRSTGASQNASGGTYIYMAFAEAPLVGTNNIPATAR